MQKPGGAPKGAPPGRRPSKAAPPMKAVKGKAAKTAGASGAAASNPNVPKAPPVAHFVCYIKGEPFTAAVAAEIPQADDLELDAAADIANMSAIVDGLGGGGDEPFKLDEPSAGGDPRNDPGGLAAALAAQANKLKPAGETPAAPEAPPAGGDLRSDPGGLAAALAAQAAKLKKMDDVAPLAAPKEKSESEMSFAELIAWKSQRLKKKEDESATPQKEEEKPKEPEQKPESPKQAPTPPQPKPTQPEESKSPLKAAPSVDMEVIEEDDDDELLTTHTASIVVPPKEEAKEASSATLKPSGPALQQSQTMLPRQSTAPQPVKGLQKP